MKLKINGKEFTIDIDSKQVKINGQSLTYKIQEKSTPFIVNIENSNFQVEEIGQELKVNDKLYIVEVEFEDKESSSIKKQSVNNEISSSNNYITAPMPGLITDIKVKIGDKVNSDTVVAVIEAMKMENEVFAGRDGTIKEILVKERQSINQNDVIFTLE